MNGNTPSEMPSASVRIGLSLINQVVVKVLRPIIVSDMRVFGIPYISEFHSHPFRFDRGELLVTSTLKEFATRIGGMDFVGMRQTILMIPCDSPVNPADKIELIISDIRRI